MSPLCTYPFLPEVQRPSPKVQGTRPIQISPQSSFNGASKFRGCSHSLMFRPPHSLDPPAAPTAGSSFLGGRAVYTAQNPVGYLPRAAASLHARLGQLAWLDSHQLECSLVGCSRTRWTANEISWSHRMPSNPNRPAEPGRTEFPIPRRFACRFDYSGVTAGADIGGRWDTPVEFRAALTPCTVYTSGRWRPPMEPRPNCLLSSGSGVRFPPGAPPNSLRNQALAAATPATRRPDRPGLTVN